MQPAAGCQFIGRLLGAQRPYSADFGSKARCIIRVMCFTGVVFFLRYDEKLQHLDRYKTL